MYGSFLSTTFVEPGKSQMAPTLQTLLMHCVKKAKPVVIPMILIMVGVGILIWKDIRPYREQQFICLARSFLDEKLYFTNMPGYFGLRG